MFHKRIGDPQALGIQYQLGNYRATYKPTVVGVMILYAAYLFFFLVGIYMSGFTTILSSVALGTAFSHGNNFPSFALSGLFGLLTGGLAFGLLFSGLALFGIVWVYRNSGLCVLVYDYGLIYLRRKPLQTIYWQNVREVRHRVRAYQAGGLLAWLRWEAHYYGVSCTDGTLHKLKWIFMKQQLGKSIERETARYLFPAALNTYQTSHAVAFGPLTLTSQGLYYGSDLLPWSQMESIRIDGLIVIRQRGRWLRWTSVKLGEVPDVEVFRMLVLHITGGFVPVHTT
jgi:hypothetical protein